MNSRRRHANPFLEYLLLCCLTACAAGCGRARGLPEPPFTLTHVGSNAWAAIDNPKAKAPSGANAGFVIGEGGVVVIDTFANIEAAEQLLAEIRRRTALPVKFVVNTHYHLDHVAGNGVFVDAGAVLLAHRNVRDWIHTENLRLVTDGMAAAHETITPEQSTFIEALTAPSAVFDEAVDLYLGGREIQVRGFPGHTGGDSVVLIPDAKIAFAGDLFWLRSLPNTVDASTKRWIDTLNALANNEAEYRFVPGHGDVGNAQDVKAFRDYLATVRTLVADAQAQGREGGAVVDAVMPALTARYGQWASFKYFARPNILEMDAELRGRKRIPQAGWAK
jgi:glyoxylase-like metal-dependent hydrolase (beta-lactamase superfamily II)